MAAVDAGILLVCSNPRCYRGMEWEQPSKISVAQAKPVRVVASTDQVMSVIWQRTGRRLARHAAEIGVLLVSVLAWRLMPPAFEYLLVSESQQELWQFEAHGVITHFQPDPRDPFVRLSVALPDVVGLPVTSDDRAGSVNGVVLTLGGDILKPGARFDKWRDTDVCLVDGKEYRFFKWLCVGNVFARGLGIE